MWTVDREFFDRNWYWELKATRLRTVDRDSLVETDKGELELKETSTFEQLIESSLVETDKGELVTEHLRSLLSYDISKNITPAVEPPV